MITDTTFFANEPGYTLLDKFKKTLKHVQCVDVLVGYFRTSGFHPAATEKRWSWRAYPSKNLHAKVYISRFKESELDFGRVS